MTPTIHHGHHLSADQQHAQLVKQTQKWVAQTFFGTLLKQMRDDPFKSEVFDGGRGGEAFGALYDQELADHMSRASGTKLVNSLVRKMEASKAYGKASKLSPKAKHTGEGGAAGIGTVRRAARIAESASVADAVTRNRP